MYMVCGRKKQTQWRRLQTLAESQARLSQKVEGVQRSYEKWAQTPPLVPTDLMMPETVKGKHIAWKSLTFFGLSYFFFFVYISQISLDQVKKNCRQNNEIEACIIWLSFLSSWAIFLHLSSYMYMIIEITLPTLSSATPCGQWWGNQWCPLDAQNKGSLGKPSKYPQTSPGVEIQNISQDFKMAWSLFSRALQRLELFSSWQTPSPLTLFSSNSWTDPFLTIP